MAFTEATEPGDLPNHDAEVAAPPITRDDGALVDMMLKNDGFRLYNRLVNLNEYRAWQPEKMERAREGMRELFEVEMAPFVRFKDPGIWGARAGIARLMESAARDEAVKEFYDDLLKRGRCLLYQNIDMRRYLGDLSGIGDFLHFGRIFTYANEPDHLPHQLRIYVTPKLDAVGHVAAEAIRHGREKGLEVCGKVWDESTNNQDISCRTDRLIFYADTQRHVDVILDSLRGQQQTNPDLFEDSPTLLSQPTDIKGVGLAESPPKGKTTKSFHESREDLLREAWNTVLNHYAPVKSRDLQEIATKNEQFKERVEQDENLKREIIDAFRRTIYELSASHGVTPDKFTTNIVFASSSAQ